MAFVFVALLICVYLFVNYIKVSSLLLDGVYIRDINAENGYSILNTTSVPVSDYIEVDEIFYITLRDYCTYIKFSIPSEKDEEYKNQLLDAGWYVETLDEEDVFLSTHTFSDEEKYIEQYQNPDITEELSYKKCILHKFSANGKTTYYFYNDIYSKEYKEAVSSLLWKETICIKSSENKTYHKIN